MPHLTRAPIAFNMTQSLDTRNQQVHYAKRKALTKDERKHEVFETKTRWIVGKRTQMRIRL